jgi:hypothetical protein
MNWTIGILSQTEVLGHFLHYILNEKGSIRFLSTEYSIYFFPGYNKGQKIYMVIHLHVTPRLKTNKSLVILPLHVFITVPCPRIFDCIVLLYLCNCNLCYVKSCELPITGFLVKVILLFSLDSCRDVSTRHNTNLKYEPPLAVVLTCDSCFRLILKLSWWMNI